MKTNTTPTNNINLALADNGTNANPEEEDKNTPAGWMRFYRKDNPQAAAKARMHDCINHLGRILAGDPTMREEIFAGILARAEMGTGRAPKVFHNK